MNRRAIAVVLATAAMLVGLAAMPSQADPVVDRSGRLGELAAFAEERAAPTVGAAVAQPKAFCREAIVEDPANDTSWLDIVIASMATDCGTDWYTAFGTWSDWTTDDFYAAGGFFDTDNSLATGCQGDDYGWIVPEPYNGVVVRMPSCDAGTWFQTGTVVGAHSYPDTVAFAFPTSAIGSPEGSFGAWLVLESWWDHEDYVPDSGWFTVPAGSSPPPTSPPPTSPPPTQPPYTPGSFNNGRCEIPYDATTTNNSVARLYEAYFLRDADAGGLGYWVPKYRSGELCLTEISDYFAQSNEFVGRYGALGNPEFVRLVYVNVLGREPDPDGYNYWAQQITYNGVSRGTMMVGFSESPEFRSRTGLP
jgi:hypothetical protein